MTELKENKVEKKEKLVNTVGVLILDGKGNILVVRHGPKARQKEGIYGFPAGHQEVGESLKQAAVRELKEETGLITSEDSLIEFPGNNFQGKIELKNKTESIAYTVFLCTYFEGNLKSEIDKTQPEWVSIKDLYLLYETLPNVLEAINNANRFLDVKK